MAFRADVLHEAGQPLVVEEVTLGAVGPRDVPVRLRASGLCHTISRSSNEEVRI